MSHRIHTEYNVQTSFELGIDFEKFCNHYHYFNKNKNARSAYDLIDYRQAVLSTNFKIPIASWIHGDVSINTQSDMRRSLGISLMSYTNTFTFRNSFEISNSLNLKESGSSLSGELYKGLFDDKVGLRASIEFDKNGFSSPSISASTGISKKIGNYH